MKQRVVADLSDLPLHAMGEASLTWWGTLTFMLLEGTGFALVLAIYLYLASLADAWPIGAPPPDLLPGTLVTVVLLISAIPNLLISRWAAQQQMTKVRLGLIVMTIFGIVAAGPAHLRVPRAAHLLGQQRLRLDCLDDAGSAHDPCADRSGRYWRSLALMFSRHGNNLRRFGDVQDNALYWNFVILTWLPIYACLYWLPRLWQ